MEQNKLKKIVEAALLAVDEPVSIERLQGMFDPTLEEVPNRNTLKDVIALLQLDYQDRGVEIKEVASGYRVQVVTECAEWINRLWEERPPKYSRALLETLAIIAYRQPVTRGEIEDIRGVSVSTNIIKILLEREWVRVAGHRDVPGRPSVYVTTRQFLDYFNLKGLSELPELPELRDLDEIEPDLFANQPGKIEGQEDSLIKPAPSDDASGDAEAVETESNQTDEEPDTDVDADGQTDADELDAVSQDASDSDEADDTDTEAADDAADDSSAETLDSDEPIETVDENPEEQADVDGELEAELQDADAEDEPETEDPANLQTTA